jgi:hypothetical protein
VAIIPAVAFRALDDPSSIPAPRAMPAGVGRARLASTRTPAYLAANFARSADCGT